MRKSVIVDNGPQKEAGIYRLILRSSPIVIKTKTV